MSQPKFSAGTDAANVTPALNALLTSKGGRWTLAKDGTALERQFKFKTFAKTWVSLELSQDVGCILLFDMTSLMI